MGERADWLVSYNPGMIENLLKFGPGTGPVLRCQIGLPSKINRIERKGEILVCVSELVRRSGGQSLDGGLGVSAVEGESRPSHRQISSLNNSVLRKSLCEVIDRAIGVSDIAREREGDSGKSFAMFSLYRRQSGLCIFFGEVHQSD